MNKSRAAVILVLISTILNAAAQTSYKFASDTFSFTVSGTLVNFPFLLGLTLYACSALLLILSLRHGELSTLYPIVSLSFVWTMLSSWLIIGETITILNSLGMLIIITGVSFLTYRQTQIAEATP